MDHPESQLPDEELRRIFTTKQLRRRALQVMVIVAVLAGFWVFYFSTNSVFGIPDTGILIAISAFAIGAFVFQAVDWRCPKCGEYLGTSASPQSCGRCGFELQI